MNQTNGADVDEEFEDKSLVFTRLKSLVRERYSKYLRNQLENNVNTWVIKAGTKPPNGLHNFDGHIEAVVESMEQKALRACMATHVYQRVMLRYIAHVRRQTEQGCLEQHLLDALECRQTFKESPLLLNDDGDDIAMKARIRANVIESGYASEDFKGHRSTTPPLAQLKGEILPSLTPLAPPTEKRVVSEGSDSIDRQLEEMFREEQTEFDAIYETPCYNDDPQMQSILNEIGMTETKTKREAKTDSRSPIASHHPQPHHHQESNHPNPHHRHQSPVAQRERRTSEKSNSLRHSPWPCELHMQRGRLTRNLTNLLLEDLRWQEVMAARFQQLFGDDSDDEFACDSPRMEMNEVVLSSCLHRISGWVVKHLMPPLQEGLIANRYLFKVLAKKLGRCIIEQNPYPNEAFVRSSVAMFFCSHPSVMSLEDIDL